MMETEGVFKAKGMLGEEKAVCNRSNKQIQTRVNCILESMLVLVSSYVRERPR